MIKKVLFWCFGIAACVWMFNLVALAAPEDFESDDYIDDLQARAEMEEVQEVTDLSQDLILNDFVSGREVISMLITQLGESKSPVVDGETFTLTGVELRSVAPVQPSGDGSLKDTLLSFVGDYDPVVVEYAYQSSQGYTSYLREIQPDYVWMISVAVLIVFIYCLFRLGGAILCKR